MYKLLVKNYKTLLLKINYNEIFYKKYIMFVEKYL